jgi:predicted nucleotidyltransferase
MKAREVEPPIVKQLIDETTPEELNKIDKQMSNKQQTAVEFLFKELLNAEPNILEWHKLLQQAKEMEKKQIEEAFANGVDDEYEYGI